MLNQYEFVNELRKLVPPGVDVENKTWAEGGYANCEAVFVIFGDNYLCTILPTLGPHGMYVTCTAPNVLRRIGIEFIADPHPFHKSELKIGEVVFRLWTTAQQEGFAWALLAEKT